MNQFEPMTMFDYLYPRFEITKPIRLIELFAGVGSQAMALRDIGVNFEHHKVVEFDKYAVDSYNAIHGTDFPIMDVTKVKGEDLEIADIDEYCYILTYSFPCQDLSIAGKGKGMTKGDNTRSGLLWEVERLLNETKHLPQVLLMENVPEVAGEKNLKDFQDWQLFLEGKGYSNYAEILNAKDYGVAQNRERCFMISILGEWNYKFPQPRTLTKSVKNYLENEVAEKYYINSQKAMDLIQQLMDSKQLEGNQQYVDKNINNPKRKDVSNCITAREDRGISKHQQEGGAIVEPNEINVIGNINPSGNGINGNVFGENGLSPTLTTNKGEGPKICTNTTVGPSVKQIGNMVDTGNWDNPQRGRIYSPEGCCPSLNTVGGGGLEPKILESTIVASRGRNSENPSDRTKGTPTEQRLEPNRKGICNTITSVQKDNWVLEPKIVQKVGDRGTSNYSAKDISNTIPANAMSDRGQLLLEPKILRPERTEYGKAIRKQYEAGEVEESRHNMTELQPREDGVSNTLTTVQKDNLLLIGKIADYNQRSEVWDSEGIAVTQTANSGGVGGTTGAYLTYDNGLLYRIRKLTPKECWRLMNFTDLDFFSAMLQDKSKAKELLKKYKGNTNGIEIMNEAENIQKTSNSQLYKQAGNSIVKAVLEGIFKSLMSRKEG